MSTQKKLITLCFATVFTLGLAACGGGGGGDAPVAGMMDGDDTDGTMTSSLVGKILPTGTTFTLPEGLVDDTTFTVPQGAPVPVPGVGTFKCVTGPCTVDVASNVVTTTGVVEVVSLADDIPDDVLALLEAEAVDAPAAPTPPTTDQMTAAAATKVKAIGVEGEQMRAADGTDDGLGGTGATTYSVDIKRDRAGTTVEIKDTANADDEPQFIKQDLDLGEGRTMHVRVNSDDEDGKVEEVVIVKTDIARAKATAFEKVKDSAGMLTQVLDVDLDPDVDANDDGEVNNDFTALTVIAITATAATAADGAVDVRALVKSAAFTSSATSADFAFDNTGTAAKDEAFETAGTYNGAIGTYRCNGAVFCTVGFDEDGKINAIGDGWIFTPARGAKSDVADAEYLHYGFWLTRTTKDGETTYNEVETFAGSKLAASVGAGIGTVEGSATYEGGSVGVYVKNVLDDQANIDSATSGHFSADVELTANFGGNNVPINDQYTIEGTVTDFVLSGGEENDWAVKLGLADFSGGREDGGAPGENARVPMFEGETTGDSTVLPGTWSGAFRGLTPVDPDDANATVAPGTVVGEFNANFTDGIAAGGFGAKKQ